MKLVVRVQHVHRILLVPTRHQQALMLVHPVDLGEPPLDLILQVTVIGF